MECADYIVIIILALVNLIAGFGFAIPITRLLGKVNGKSKGIFRYFVILIGIYFIECIALAAGMATQVFSFGLAFVWGIILGLWLRYRAPAREVIRTSFFIALYSSLPTVSLAILAIIGLFVGQPVLSAEAGYRFGIPDYLHLPWPLNTILGFFGVIALATVIFKTLITTGEVSLLIHLGEKPAKGDL